MRFSKLTKEDKMLIDKALDTIKRNRIETKAISASVGVALMTDKGKIYFSTNIKNYLSSPTSICAEMGAIASMFSEGERKIKTIVAVHIPDRKSNYWRIIPPCGACRHVLHCFGNPWVIVSVKKKVKLRELYPLPVRPYTARDRK
ncbi:MAG: hypothetical protein QXM75_01250 [Candidatus Diapherotrites archaeon]